jgi:hypothetical protein
MKLRDYHPLNRAQLVRTASIMLHHFAPGFANPCKVCGSQPSVISTSADGAWKTVVPTKYWNKVVCVECFGNFACETQIELVRGSNLQALRHLSE